MTTIDRLGRRAGHVRERHCHGIVSARTRFVSMVLLTLLTMSSPAWARIVNLEATAPVPDRSHASIERAIQSALDGCVRQATALGLTWIRLRDAVLTGNQITLEVVATDEPDEAGKQNMVPTWDRSVGPA
jgi:hypothetical protein